MEGIPSEWNVMLRIGSEPSAGICFLTSYREGRILIISRYIPLLSRH